MALQTRVTPFGEITAAPWRGTLMGNRGCLHGPDGRLGRARWRGKGWVSCRLEFRGRWRPVMPPPGAPTRYTALFFWDEVTALAAGHRPCGECRHSDHQRFRAAWEGAGLPGNSAREIDAVLHAARIGPGRAPSRTPARLEDLPDGAMAVTDEAPATALLRWAGGWLRWTDPGYAPHPDPRPGPCRLLTPRPVVDVLAAGYAPEIRLGDETGR